jgi:SWI/SNF-related matrix-associated actin-dependent regulator 1 of chromatin subfamily A
MSSIRAIDQYTLECTKTWTEQDQFLASCLDITAQDNKHYVDVRIVAKRALNHYLKQVFPHIMFSPDSVGYRAALFQNLKGMYDQVFNDFMLQHYPKANYSREMYMHQKETLAASIYRKYNLWALDMGTGKTLTGATLSKLTSARRTIIICPSLVKWNWFEDMTRFWGYNPLYWTILDSIKSKSMYAFKERFVVLNYEQVAKQMDYLLRDEINHIIIDEAHYLKNHNSGRSKAVKELNEKAGFPRITMMTGTPVTNRINDMFNYLKMSKHPLGQNYEGFKRQYTVSASVRGGKIIGAKNIDDLKGKISNLMIRLRSEDCLDLPALVIKNYYFESDELTDDYQKELDALKSKKERYDSLHGKEKAQMGHEIRTNIHTLNRLVTTSKVNQIKTLIDHLVELGEKVVVFSGYKDPLTLLESKLGKSCVKIDGSVNPHKRQQLINKFKEKDSCTTFLGNMQAAGIGINLVNARHVIFMNFPFTPDQIEQAQKRLHRSGQKSTVNVYYTIAKETIDEHIYSIIADKAGDINTLIDGDHSGVVNYNNIAGELFKRLLE